MPPPAPDTVACGAPMLVATSSRALLDKPVLVPARMFAQGEGPGLGTNGRPVATAIAGWRGAAWARVSGVCAKIRRQLGQLSVLGWLSMCSLLEAGPGL